MDAPALAPPRHDAGAAPAARPWWVPPAPLALLTIVALGFLAFALPPYVSLDPHRSRIPAPAWPSLYYPVLVGHVAFASVAMLAALAQVWPALRRRHLGLHRRLGFVYVFGGVVPAGIAGLAIGAVSPFGPVLRASDVLLATLWLACTLSGFGAARARRQADHRRWMLRSVTLTMSIITNRIWAVVFTLLLGPQLHTTFGGSEVLLGQTIAGLSGWLGWVLPLLVTEWWLIDRRHAVRVTPRAAPSRA